MAVVLLVAAVDNGAKEPDVCRELPVEWVDEGGGAYDLVRGPQTENVDRKGQVTCGHIILHVGKKID